MIRSSDFRFLQDGSSKNHSGRSEDESFSGRLFFENQARFAPVLAEPAGSFSLAILSYTAMMFDEGLEIDSPVSPDFLHDIQDDLHSWPTAHRCDLKIPVTSSLSNVLLPKLISLIAPFGFSAGAVSFSKPVLLTKNHVSEGRGLIGLTTFGTGPARLFGQANDTFEKYGQRVHGQAEINGCQWQTIRLDVNSFYKFLNPGFQDTHRLHDAAGAFLLQDILGHHVYSSSYPYTAITLCNDDMAHVEPILLSFFSTEAIHFVSARKKLKPLHKTRLVPACGQLMTIADGCVASTPLKSSRTKMNESRYWKCFPTFLALAVSERLDDFLTVFGIGYHRTHRDRVLLHPPAASRLGKLIERALLAWMGTRRFSFRTSACSMLKLNLSHLTVCLCGGKGPGLAPAVS